MRIMELVADTCDVNPGAQGQEEKVPKKDSI